MNALFMQSGSAFVALNTDRERFAGMIQHIPHVRFGAQGARLFPVAYIQALRANPRHYANVKAVRAFNSSGLARLLTQTARRQLNAAFQGDRMFTVGGVTDILGVTDRTVHNWHSAGLFPGAQYFSTRHKRLLQPGEIGRTELVIPGADILRAVRWIVPTRP